MKAAKLNAATVAISSVKDAVEHQGVFGPEALMQLLYRKAKPHLTPSDFGWIVRDGSSYAEGVARNAAQFAERVGCLVADDGRADGVNAGHFQSHRDVPGLLFHLANVFDQLAGLADVIGDAADEMATEATQTQGEAT